MRSPTLFARFVLAPPESIRIPSNYALGKAGRQGQLAGLSATVPASWRWRREDPATPSEALFLGRCPRGESGRRPGVLRDWAGWLGPGIPIAGQQLPLHSQSSVRYPCRPRSSDSSGSATRRAVRRPLQARQTARCSSSHPTPRHGRHLGQGCAVAVRPAPAPSPPRSVRPAGPAGSDRDTPRGRPARQRPTVCGQGHEA